ncbi:hypothetical protein L249_2882 [Ophiocordyceps polyrhachis-furcata BCC 54312]|uniref:Exonuclease V n=1 Tax=Ophiocordyceps polyrhachis-furcata BCC 54312 TaxID=1330021 RepID=A0A367LR24_9HYPO|nr:hypothetical protein L249_2882 [Ophiocordyceps polyrhachis-furcata BCC 54312]
MAHMAASSSSSSSTTAAPFASCSSSSADDSSSYGYDFTPEDELQLFQLVAEASSGHHPQPPQPPPPPPPPPRRHHHHVGGLEKKRLPDEVDYPDPKILVGRALSKLRKQPNDDESSATTTTTTASPSLLPPPSGPSTTISPLQRFRSFPRKPLSVSDLTSGAWCELQYWYTLSRLPGGRRSRTPAMRQGSKVHQQLEDEVHVRVKVEVLSREDSFALKLWNFIQGLRTLRRTGLTRELEVWGMVDGNLVNGIIDGLSHENPNPDFEEELSSQASSSSPPSSSNTKSTNTLPLTDYFPPLNKTPSSGPKVYLTDVKTRGSTAPVSGAQLRPAKIQLLLYHRFLSAMASDELDFDAVVGRYGLNAHRLLSDTFLAQMGGLHQEVFYDAPSSPVEDGSVSQQSSSSSSSSSSSYSDEPIRYRSLREIWSLLRQETKLTFPQGRTSLGHILRVQYVHRSDGRCLDAHDFPVSNQALDAYLSRYMAWWRGERRAKGVDIEEAFKCRSCDFASDCEWRLALDGQRLEAAQKKLGSRGRKKKKKENKVADGGGDGVVDD